MISILIGLPHSSQHHKTVHFFPDLHKTSDIWFLNKKQQKKIMHKMKTVSRKMTEGHLIKAQLCTDKN